MGLKVNGLHHLLVSADNVNLLDDDMDTIRKTTETLIYASVDVGLGVNRES
jgi:hypothetical protein